MFPRGVLTVCRWPLNKNLKLLVDQIRLRNQNIFYCCVPATHVFRSHSSSVLTAKGSGSRSFSSTKMTKKDSNTFNINNYDIIGFDLDGTLLRYNLEQMVSLEYTCLSNYLISQGYAKEKLKKSFSDDVDFIQKGLILDAPKGNLLKLDKNGRILKAIHGASILSDAEIVKMYGAERKWHVSSEFIKNPLNTWNGPLSEQMRTLLDYFDIPVSLLMSRAVSSLNEKSQKPKDYKVWDDILAGLFEIYKREHYASEKSEYFRALKKNPEKYILKTNPKVIKWLQDMKNSNKSIYLLTGSNIDFANFTASYALGDNWRDLFDCVITYARKPGFFVELDRPFYRVDLKKLEESEEIPCEEGLNLNCTYSQGNWLKLRKLLKTKVGVENPKSLYVGDNLVQDVLCPAKFTDMDTVAISEEMFAEGIQSKDIETFNRITSSKTWGSYYELNKSTTLWADIIANNSKICVPTIDYLIELDKKTIDDSGYYPAPPKIDDAQI